VSDVPSSPSIAIELRRDRADLAVLSERVEQFGERHGLPAGLISTMNLVLEEAVTNVIDYAFDEGDVPMIRVRLTYTGQSLTAAVEDNGRPFDPLQAPLPATDVPIEEREVGGLGITLIRKMMDRVEYSRTPSTNVLVLSKDAE
jgi:anti-sigma regulatory factor (Ser/Thr protein kinase)